MSVREAVDTTSRAFATGGEDFAYYLSDSRAMQEFTAPAHRGCAPNDRGSRQSTTIQLPTAILRNMGVYLIHRLGTRRRVASSLAARGERPGNLERKWGKSRSARDV